MSLPNGVIVSGLYLGGDVVQDKDGNQRAVIAVAVGMQAYRVYLNGLMNGKSYNLGDPVCVLCVPFAGKSGVGFSHGQIL